MEAKKDTEPHSEEEFAIMANAENLESQLHRHLEKVEQDPTEPLDQRLFDECGYMLAAEIMHSREKLYQLVMEICAILPKLEQDPTPVIRLLQKLVEPFTFDDILRIKPPVDFVAGLDKIAVPYHPLLLDLLAKATEYARDAAVLAGMPGVVHALVRLWLSASDMGTADKAAKVLIELLKVDREVIPDESSTSGGQGLIWRRVFGDKDVYGLFYSIPSLANHSKQDLSKREKSVSQARLMSVLPEIGVMDWAYLTRSHHADIEAQYGLKPGEGLMHFACTHLVDYKNDVLLHMNLLQFFADLISTITTASASNTTRSVSLQFMFTQKTHEQAMSFWLEPDNPTHDPVDVNFLYGPSAHYIAFYLSLYPNDFLGSTTCRRVLQRLSRSLDINANHWAHGESPKHDLHIMSSIPRLALLPQTFLGTGRQSSPLLLIPCKVANEDALHTLAAVLGGPRISDPAVAQLTTAEVTTEKQTARLLFHYYLATHDTLFSDLITHADTVALPAKALASLALLSALVSAPWAPLPAYSATAPVGNNPDLSLKLPAESTLRSPSSLPIRTIYHLPASGPSLLLHPPARDVLLPYLLRPARTFANLVGGRGDTESAAYRIAMAKWELLLLVQKGLRDMDVGRAEQEASGLIGVREAVERRVREGVWGSEGEIGGRIATLEL